MSLAGLKVRMSPARVVENGRGPRGAALLARLWLAQLRHPLIHSPFVEVARWLPAKWR